MADKSKKSSDTTWFTASSNVSGGGAAGGGGGGAGRSGSTIDVVYGRRPVKGYPITESELSQLFGFGL